MWDTHKPSCALIPEVASSKLEHMLVHITVFVSIGKQVEKAIGREQTEILFFAKCDFCCVL